MSIVDDKDYNIAVMVVALLEIGMDCFGKRVALVAGK
jgi:hypothetical protein